MIFRLLTSDQPNLPIMVRLPSVEPDPECRLGQRTQQQRRIDGSDGLSRQNKREDGHGGARA